MQITKLYENVTDEPIHIREMALEVPAHDRVSTVSEFPTPFNPVNYPGLVEVGGLTEDEHNAKVEQAKQAYLAAHTDKQIRGAMQSTKVGGDAYPRADHPNASLHPDGQADATSGVAPTGQPPEQPASIQGGLDIQKNPEAGGQQDA